MENNQKIIQEDEIDLRELFLTIWRKKVFIVLLTFIVTVSSILYINFKPYEPLYQGKLLVEIGEVFNKNNTPLYKIYSDNDSLLIGKNGKNLKSLQILVGQAINKEINQNFKFTIDINDYQEKKERNLIRLAKNIAREVSQTKVEAKLDSMNSYERRIIHNALANSSKVYTESCGEEPERYVVIKPKGE